MIEDGDLLVLYTDGVTEARKEGEMFGEERLVGFVRAWRHYARGRCRRRSSTRSCGSRWASCPMMSRSCRWRGREKGSRERGLQWQRMRRDSSGSGSTIW
ncbi:MAG: SpoIIE family protein phosphatase [Coriobacteriia bacterium]